MAALGAWFAVLNLLTAVADLPGALHGHRVEVTVRSCRTYPSGLRTCLGDYRLGSVVVTGRNVLGGDTLREGSTVRATTAGDTPGDPSIADPRLGVGEAALFTLAGLATAGLALVTVRRRSRRRPGAAHPPSPDRATLGDDDPLAWVRRRRFGAGRD